MPEATAAKKFGQWVPSKHLTELHYFGFFELYSRHQQHSHTFSHYLASQNLTTLDSPSQAARLHYLTSLHSACSCAFSNLCLGEASRSIWNGIKVPTLAGKGCRSILRKFAAEMNKWANQWNNFVPSGRPSLIWRQLVEWLIGEWSLPTHPPPLAAIPQLKCLNQDTDLSLVNLGKSSILIGQSGQILIG